MKPMNKPCIVFLLMLSLLAACQKDSKKTDQQRDELTQLEPIGIEGTDSCYIINQGDSTFYFYENYTVMTIPYADESGEEIRIYPRQSNLYSKLYPEKVQPVVSIHKAAQWFFGIANGLLFLDIGTGPDVRTLEINAIQQNKIVFSGKYTEPIEIENGRLSFYQETQTAINAKNCPDAEEWKSKGLGAAIEEKVFLDLTTFKCIKTGEIRCSPRQ
jgi:hypothetical protein